MSFHEHLTSLNQNSVLVGMVGLASSVASILGISLVQVCKELYALIHPQKKLVCILLSEAKIKKSDCAYKGLEVKYNHDQIDRFTITKIKFWNDSEPIIYGKDVEGQYSLNALVNGGKILECRTLKGDKSENNIVVNTINENTARITFGMLHRLEGGTIEIYHTGAEDSVSLPQEIDGGKINVMVDQKQKSKKVRFLRKMIYLSIVIAIPVLSILYSKQPKESVFVIVIASIVIIVFVISLFLAIYLSLKDIMIKKFTPINCRDEN